MVFFKNHYKKLLDGILSKFILWFYYFILVYYIIFWFYSILFYGFILFNFILSNFILWFYYFTYGCYEPSIAWEGWGLAAVCLFVGWLGRASQHGLAEEVAESISKERMP